MKLQTVLRQSRATICRSQSNILPPVHRAFASEKRCNNASPPATRDVPRTRDYDVDPENRTVATAVGDLPLSPVMDSKYWESTTRHKQPKPKPGRGQTSVERQFRANPYAKALATPLRECAATRVLLPNYFLQDFNLISHPENNRPWWVPHSLMQEESNGHTATDTSDAQERSTANAPADKLDQINVNSDIEADKIQPGQPHPSQPFGPSAYILARRELLSSFTDPKSGYSNFNKRLMTFSSSQYTRFGGAAIWRQGMDVFILDRLRKGIIDELLYISKLVTEDSRYYIVKCFGWDDVKFKHNGALLWFPDEGSSAEPPPGPFETYEYEKDDVPTAMPVHNLSLLLGSEGAKRVKEEGAAFRDGFLFVLARRRTLDLQLKLWRLQGYLFESKSEAAE